MQTICLYNDQIYYSLLCRLKILNFLTIIFSFHRFLENKEDIAKLCKCFAGLWSLDDEEIIKTAIEKPESFVLKPQREGGGLYVHLHMHIISYCFLNMLFVYREQHLWP